MSELPSLALFIVGLLVGVIVGRRQPRGGYQPPPLGGYQPTKSNGVGRPPRGGTGVVRGRV